MISVLLVDDEALVRAGLRMILETADDITVVGDAGDGRAAIDAVDRYRPDVVLMDLRMPRLDGLAATAAIRARAHPPSIVVLTTFDAEIARHLYMSEATVKTHITHLFDKLSAANRVQLAIAAFRAGLVE